MYFLNSYEFWGILQTILFLGRDPASVSNGWSDVANLGRLKFRTLSQLNNLTGPCALTLDHKRRQFIFVCFRSLSELVVLSSKWDPEEKIKDSMETDQDVAVETVKQSNKSRPNSQKVRRSSRLEAKRRAFYENTKEVKPEVIIPMEATKRFMKELGESSEWKKVGDLPTVILSNHYCCRYLLPMIFFSNSLGTHWFHLFGVPVHWQWSGPGSC